MAQFVGSSDEFSTILQVRKSLIRDDAVLPDDVFCTPFRSFRVLDAARVLSHEFLDLALGLSTQFGRPKIALTMIDPDPFEYYYRLFRKYGVITFDCSDSADDVLTLCMESPPESPADAISFIVSIFALFPVVEGMPDWCVFHDRVNCEAGIIGFKDASIARVFVEMDNDHVTVEPREALETFMAVPLPSHTLPDEFKRRFLRNYADQQ